MQTSAALYNTYINYYFCIICQSQTIFIETVAIYSCIKIINRLYASNIYIYIGA